MATELFQAPPQKVYTNAEVRQIAEEGIDALCESVQRKLGIKYGDFAALFWSDERLLSLIDDYVSGEIEYREDI